MATKKPKAEIDGVPVWCSHDDIRDLASLVPNPKNPNTHPLPQIKLLGKIIKEQGWRGPITVSLRSGMIVKGHGRREAALQAGLVSCPVDLQEYESEAAEHADMIADNRIAELAEMDAGKLSDLLNELKVMDLDMELTGFTEDEFEKLLSEKEGLADAEPQTDKAAELNKTWKVKTGDLWQIGEHRLLCGDSTKAEDVARVMGGEKAGAIIADPPYGMRLDADFSGMVNNLKITKGKGMKRGRKYNNVIGDHEDFNAVPIISAIGDPAIQFWFGADYYSKSLPDVEHSGAWLVWDKRLDESADKMFGSCFELIWARQKCKRDMIRIKWAGIFGTEKEPQRGRQHPNQKPVELLVNLAERTKGIIVDPFAGSGTCLIACQNLNHKCRGIEISPNYCAVILQRMTDAFPDIEIKKIEQ